MGNSTETTKDRKDQIAKAFGDAAGYYDEHAALRKDVAQRLIASLEPWRSILPKGPIIELGCGTGFVTQGLADLYSQRKIIASDISDSMLDFCRDKLSDEQNISCKQLDADEPDREEPHYAMTISGFTAHWLDHPAISLGKWLEATKPGGLVLVSFPGNESYPEWKEKCQELGLPFTGMELPDVEEMVVKMSVGPAQVDYYEDTVTRSFESARAFFEHRKSIGAETPKEGGSLDPDDREMLINHWDDTTDGDISVSYHLVFLVVKRDYDS